MFKAVSIVLNRAEGPSDLCNKPVILNSFDQATQRLRAWSYTAPINGGYDKIDFTITFDNGEVYRGRYDLENKAGIMPLDQHCLQYLTFASGRKKPLKFTDDQWETILKRDPERQTLSEAWLTHYHFGD
jgi:hypothetical protein